jgi:hypothetical protein
MYKERAMHYIQSAEYYASWEPLSGAAMHGSIFQLEHALQQKTFYQEKPDLSIQKLQKGR